ncbi:MAG: 3-hydroxy-3-methylglutaryl-CoA reductase, partial [Nitrososphaeria archaeon]|nr:3-hydroxy-3-methylglutaryl-CoA reductase [Nitrososphaeria archaeon]
AAAHAYAAKSGKYRSLTQWSKDKNGNLVGKIELPLSVGIVGGIINIHPTAKICSKILQVKSASELACVIVAAGLAQNLSAIRALASEGIQKGHMRLHARNIAAAAGATLEQIDAIATKMAQEGNVSINRAKELLDKQ